MKIGVIPNLTKDIDGRTTAAIVEKLKNLGAEPLLPTDSINCDFIHLDPYEINKTADIIIAVGGDGTIIHAAKAAARFGKPVLGVNAGRLGYMAGLETDELDSLSKLISGEYTVEKRMMLKAELVCEEHRIFYCLNDVVVSGGRRSSLIDITVTLDGQQMCYRSDGMIFATPTGSTAYSISAGGPIVDPAIDGILMTPICPHSLNARSVLISADKLLKIEARGDDVYLTPDGEEAVDISGKELLVSAAEDTYCSLIKIKKDSFYSVLSRKMIKS